MRVKLREIAEAAVHDPKQALLDAVGDISGVEVFLNRVLVATYIEPEITTGGVYLPDRSLAENRFQGKVGLVLKLGPLAFRDDSVVKFGGVTVEPGDWVICRPSDGFELYSVDAGRQAGTSCRFYEDTVIMGRVDDPAAIW